MTERAPLSSPGVRFPPPLLFVGGLVAGWLLDRRVRPLPLAADGDLLATLGTLLVAVADSARVRRFSLEPAPAE